MEASLFLVIITIIEILLVIVSIIVAIKTSFKNYFAVFQVIMLMGLVLIFAISSLSCKVIDYENSDRQYVATKVTYQEDKNSYYVETDNNYIDDDLKLYIYSDSIDKTTLIVNSRVKIKTVFGYTLYIKKNILVVKPKEDFSKMSSSERKSKLKELNNTRFLLY